MNKWMFYYHQYDGITAIFKQKLKHLFKLNMLYTFWKVVFIKQYL